MSRTNIFRPTTIILFFFSFMLTSLPSSSSSQTIDILPYSNDMRLQRATQPDGPFSSSSNYSSGGLADGGKKIFASALAAAGINRNKRFVFSSFGWGPAGTPRNNPSGGNNNAAAAAASMLELDDAQPPNLISATAASTAAVDGGEYIHVRDTLIQRSDADDNDESADNFKSAAANDNNAELYKAQRQSQSEPLSSATSINSNHQIQQAGPIFGWPSKINLLASLGLESNLLAMQWLRNLKKQPTSPFSADADAEDSLKMPPDSNNVASGGGSSIIVARGAIPLPFLLRSRLQETLRSGGLFASKPSQPQPQPQSQRPSRFFDATSPSPSAVGLYVHPASRQARDFSNINEVIANKERNDNIVELRRHSSVGNERIRRLFNAVSKSMVAN